MRFPGKSDFSIDINSLIRRPFKTLGINSWSPLRNPNMTESRRKPSHRHRKVPNLSVESRGVCCTISIEKSDRLMTSPHPAILRLQSETEPKILHRTSGINGENSISTECRVPYRVVGHATVFRNSYTLVWKTLDSTRQTPVTHNQVGK